MKEEEGTDGLNSNISIIRFWVIKSVIYMALALAFMKWLRPLQYLLPHPCFTLFFLFYFLDISQLHLFNIYLTSIEYAFLLSFLPSFTFTFTITITLWSLGSDALYLLYLIDCLAFIDRYHSTKIQNILHNSSLC